MILRVFCTGYQGNDCEENIDECASDPCQNEATCVDEIASYHCICNSGFHGKNCEENIDDCINVECKNNATCVDQVNGFQCICPEGFTGKKCELNIDECDSNPCLNEARLVVVLWQYLCCSLFQPIPFSFSLFFFFLSSFLSVNDGNNFNNMSITEFFVSKKA